MPQALGQGSARRQGARRRLGTIGSRVHQAGGRSSSILPRCLVLLRSKFWTSASWVLKMARRFPSDLGLVPWVRCLARCFVYYYFHQTPSTNRHPCHGDLGEQRAGVFFAAVRCGSCSQGPRHSRGHCLAADGRCCTVPLRTVDIRLERVADYHRDRPCQGARYVRRSLVGHAEHVFPACVAVRGCVARADGFLGPGSRVLCLRRGVCGAVCCLVPKEPGQGLDCCWGRAARVVWASGI
mmetsp:Transcript_5249/g.12487  ORF Transcript_5249/g.12487 Transcript_5249/m.12487 type:complete len:239 (-) Transcript_5249:183-899(-)